MAFNYRRAYPGFFLCWSLPLFSPAGLHLFVFCTGLEVKTSLFCPFLLLPVSGLMHFGRGEILSQEFGAGAGVFVLLPLAAGLGLSVPLPTLAAGPGLWVRGDDRPQAPADGLLCWAFLGSKD